MTLINFIVILVVIGLILWLVNTYIPMDAKIKNILNIVVIIAIVLWLLNIFIGYGPIGNIRIGR